MNVKTQITASKLINILINSTPENNLAFFSITNIERISGQKESAQKAIKAI